MLKRMAQMRYRNVQKDKSTLPPDVVLIHRRLRAEQASRDLTRRIKETNDFNKRLKESCRIDEDVLKIRFTI